MSAPTRDDTRRRIADNLLSSLDELVRRHRALAMHGTDSGDHVELHAELIAAEVAHQLAMTRSALHRHPPLRQP
ncbi:hypothetical protein [Pseudonocardia sp. GCM10023141]|uniref:hypothetical protein n=1 Tax=Pseudonocardia sp. GCM10023141 TaxID=3252653 RepID=UPI00362095D1